MAPQDKRVEAVSIQFRDSKTPYSPHFQDIYFTPSTGVEESRYVYLEGSGFSTSLEKGTPEITIAEIGFGVGLNFLITLKEFIEKAKPGQTLHYISVEKFPVIHADLKTLYEAYPDLKGEADALLNQYPILTPGVHRLHFFENRVTLDLILGDALSEFRNLQFKAQHWYWDGFAPSRNQDAFSMELFQEVARLSTKRAQGASFTAATWVRTSLKEAGFEVLKRPGFGPKRECIQAVFQKEETESILPAWFSSQGLTRIQSKSETIAVLGAGLAGSAIARKFANLGFKVRVYDGNGIGTRASSNSVGLFNIQLSRLPNPISRFSQAALTHFLREIKTLQIPHRLGILRQDASVESLQNSDFPKNFYEVRENAIFFPECGFLNPHELCKQRLDHPLIEFNPISIVSVLNQGPHLKLTRSDGQIDEAPAQIVYAMGADLTLPENKIVHESLTALPIRPIRGQSILVKPTSHSESLDALLVNEGYASPITPEITGHGFHLLGATYQAKNIEANQEQIDTEKLLQEAQVKWPQFSKHEMKDVVLAKVGFRLSTPDKLPLIGPLCDAHALEKDYGHALKGSRVENLPPLSGLPREWMLLGLGSRGITFSSLSAEILISMMLGLPLPIELDLLEHLHSARFLIRNLKKPKVN